MANRTPNNNIRVFYDYMVQGLGTFPVDMLRYDSCWPKRQEDVTAIQRYERNKIRIVHIRSYRLPTFRRWESFGWTVVEHAITPA